MAAQTDSEWKAGVHLCQQGEEAYLLAIFLRMRRMILPDLVFGSPERCTDVIRTQDCCCKGLSKSPGHSSSTGSAKSLLPRKSSSRVPLQTVQAMSNGLTWSPVDDIRSGDGANDLSHGGHQLLFQLSRRRIFCALHHAIPTVMLLMVMFLIQMHDRAHLDRPQAACGSFPKQACVLPYRMHHIAVQS